MNAQESEDRQVEPEEFKSDQHLEQNYVQLTSSLKKIKKFLTMKDQQRSAEVIAEYFNVNQSSENEQISSLFSSP